MNAARIQSEKVEVRGRINHETEAAVYISIETMVGSQRVRGGVWFPLSQIHSIHRTYNTLGYDTLFVTPWIAKKKGIID